MKETALLVTDVQESFRHRPYWSELDRVAERAGFGSSRHMRRIWRQHDATSPGRWRRREPRSR